MMQNCSYSLVWVQGLWPTAINSRMFWIKFAHLHSDIGDIKTEIYEMLTQPTPIGVADEDDLNKSKAYVGIDQIVENAGNRVSVELTDQLWELLKS